MDQLEETVVNPNISLNNFEVKIREHETSVQKSAVVDNTDKKNHNSKGLSRNNKSLLLLALITAVFIYQLSVII
ncbi:MAG: hypothetical protein R8G33_09670 [Gammaproteobacteria bacterium]|nr:hypothetical protein [Gammaproteobacteria bacterium]